MFAVLTSVFHSVLSLHAAPTKAWRFMAALMDSRQSFSFSSSLWDNYSDAWIISLKLNQTWLRRSGERYPPCANKMQRDDIM